MNSRIIASVLLVLLIAIPSANALFVTAPDKVPEKNVWGFSIELGALDTFFDAEAYFNSEKLFTYQNSQIVDPFESSNLVSYRKAGNTISVTMLGKPSGTYDLVVRTRLSGGQIVEEKSLPIHFVSLLDETDRQALMDDLNSTRNTIADLKTKTDDISTKLDSQTQTNSSQATELASLSDKLAKAEQAVVSLQESLSSLNTFDQSSAAQFSEIKTELETAKQKLETLSPSSNTGLFGLLGNGNWMLALLVIGIVIVAFVVYQYRQQNF